MPNFQYGHANQIPSATQAAAMDINSIFGGFVDRGTWVYHDTLTQAAGASALSSYMLFKQPIGSPDQITAVVKTKLQTNLSNSGQFAPPRCLILNQLGFYFCAPYSTSSKNSGMTVQQDIIAMCNSAYFEFVIDNKVFFEGRLEWHPPGIGITGFSTNSNEESWGLGIQSPHAVYNFGNYAKYIAPLQNFGLNIYLPMGSLPVWSATGNGMNLVVLMKGLTDRSVQ